MNRRDFSKNVARFGLVGAAGIFLGVKKVAASTHCVYTGTHENRQSTSCGGWSCWHLNQCYVDGCVPCGYYDWVRSHCGVC